MALKASPATTSVGALLKCFPTASPFSPPPRSSLKRLTCPAPSSSSTAATRNGTKPVRAKRPTTKLSTSSPKPKPSSPPLPKGTKRDPSDSGFQQKGPAPEQGLSQWPDLEPTQLQIRPLRKEIGRAHV